MLGRLGGRAGLASACRGSSLASGVAKGARGAAALGARWAQPGASGARAALSTVAANTIKLTFVDHDGNRATVPARLGQSILDVALQHKVDLEGPCGGGGSPTEVRRTENWVETTYGEGPSCFFCHVQIPTSFNAVLPEQTKEETAGLADVWEDEVTKTSRLACMITLEKKHDGLVVYIPDAPPTNVI